MLKYNSVYANKLLKSNSVFVYTTHFNPLDIF
jgi:hypothetical protein